MVTFTFRGWRIHHNPARAKDQARFQIYHRFPSNFSFPLQATIHRYTPYRRIIGLGQRRRRLTLVGSKHDKPMIGEFKLSAASPNLATPLIRHNLAPTWLQGVINRFPTAQQRVPLSPLSCVCLLFRKHLTDPGEKLQLSTTHNSARNGWERNLQTHSSHPETCPLAACSDRVYVCVHSSPAN